MMEPQTRRPVRAGLMRVTWPFYEPGETGKYGHTPRTPAVVFHVGMKGSTTLRAVRMTADEAVEFATRLLDAALVMRDKNLDPSNNPKGATDHE